MSKMYTVTYINDDPKAKYTGLVHYAEVCADNIKQAKEIFFRHHDKTCSIVTIKFKRKWR